MTGSQGAAASGTVLVASDLDRTLIYSRSALDTFGGPTTVVAVERYRDDDASWMTTAAAEGLARLTGPPGDGVLEGRRVRFVPVTTRTPEQYARVRLPGPAPRYAVTANGGVLLVDGVPDAGWTARVRSAAASGAGVAEVRAWAQQACHAGWSTSVRTAADLFCYAAIDRASLPEGFVAAAAAWAGERGWRVSLQGRKLYWVPEAVTKAAAVAEIARRTGAQEILAAGDSLLDQDLLAAADAGIMARHGELAASGWRATQVGITSASGIAAGEEIVSWFAQRVGVSPVTAG